ncbi:Acetoin utilization deacetylase AcuC [Thermosyntropha lipolytica DSM 11003]|uniref:Acetoin utilization deacetylase AcuC n=1 Tax=Thermosyntropha lipolytica DSM 11003 TaxID=1123382 RepID=A0A1M5Q482_9FIRM|nr:hypothetical protein [Thermosyntropha lipolytica]SHH08303.1 Acetoin utilization deacetylase AcuC [Thermosyntropha lipolytica DSM 11003]
MKIIFSEEFFTSYAIEPAADPGRLDHAYKLLKGKYEFVKPSPCEERDILLVHVPSLIYFTRTDEVLYNTAKLAAGAAILASQYAIAGEMAFALCRPPGHHASEDFQWGYCYFNNIAIAVQKLIMEGKIKKALIIDFDLHFGDGTAKIFKDNPQVEYFHIPGRTPETVYENLSSFLKSRSCDLVAVSAGFDRHEHDWGGMLPTAAYHELGKMLGNFARDKCQGRLFSVLEGGYNRIALGESIKAFLEGLEDKD